jgi:hypothetical protein
MSHTGTSSLLTRKGNADNMVSAIKYESFKMLVNFFGAFTFEITLDSLVRRRRPS